VRQCNQNDISPKTGVSRHVSFDKANSFAWAMKEKRRRAAALQGALSRAKIFVAFCIALHAK
jgi:hypothetical protein